MPRSTKGCVFLLIASLFMGSAQAMVGVEDIELGGAVPPVALASRWSCPRWSCHIPSCFIVLTPRLIMIGAKLAYDGASLYFFKTEVDRMADLETALSGVSCADTDYPCLSVLTPNILDNLKSDVHYRRNMNYAAGAFESAVIPFDLGILGGALARSDNFIDGMSSVNALFSVPIFFFNIFNTADSTDVHKLRQVQNTAENLIVQGKLRNLTSFPYSALQNVSVAAGSASAGEAGVYGFLWGMLGMNLVEFVVLGCLSEND